MITDRPASEAQLNFLRDLARRKPIWGTDLDVTATQARMFDVINAGLTSTAASALLSSAANMADRADGPAKPWQIQSLRGFAETHAIFGLHVSPADTKQRIEDLITAGLDEHTARTLRRQALYAKPHPTAVQPLPLHNIDGIEGLDVAEGAYAVLVEGELRFYRIYSPTTGEYQGVPVIRRYASDNLLGLYPNEAAAAITAINLDPQTAAYRFSDEHTRCYVCTRRLTDSISRLLSVGPQCRGFDTHSGLRIAATAVDTDPVRRASYRAVREWALGTGYRDPRNRAERDTMQGQITASRVAAGWTGLPGLLDNDPAAAVDLIKESLSGRAIPPRMADMLTSAPADTAVDLIATGVLTAPLVRLFNTHPSRKVRNAAAEFFLTALGG